MGYGLRNGYVPDFAHTRRKSVHDNLMELPRTDLIFELIIIRGATLIRENILFSRTLRNTIIFPATNVCLTSQNTRLCFFLSVAFDCALSGPFNKLLSAGSQRSRLSVSATSVFISTSTVYMVLFNYSVFYHLWFVPVNIFF